MITAPPIWKKKLHNRWLLPSGKFNPWLAPVYGNVKGGDMMPKSPSWTGRPSGIDGGLVAGNARVASGTTIPQTSTAGKKGLSMNNMIKALSEMKKPPDMSPAPAGAYGERRPQLPAPPQFAALGGVNPSIMNTGGLPGARNKKWWEIMGYS